MVKKIPITKGGVLPLELLATEALGAPKTMRSTETAVACNLVLDGKRRRCPMFGWRMQRNKAVAEAKVSPS